MRSGGLKRVSKRETEKERDVVRKIERQREKDREVCQLTLSSLHPSLKGDS